MSELSLISALKRGRLYFARPPGEPDPLDFALARLAGCAPRVAGGGFIHLPMVLETLDANGLAWRIPETLRQALQGGALQPAPPLSAPIQADRAGDADAHGDEARYADWRAFFLERIATDGWRETLAETAAAFAASAQSAACHVLIRTAHAARALLRRDTPARRGELASALASWAAMHKPPQRKRAATRGDLDPAEALALIRDGEPGAALSEGSISAGIKAGAAAPGVAEAVARADLSGPAEAAADRVLAAFARLFLQRARDGYTALVFTHAITGVTAARRLAPLVDQAAARRLVFEAFEAGAAMKAGFAAHPIKLADDSTPRPKSAVARAASGGAEHAIKLADALTEAYARTGDRVFAEACERGIALLDG
mgnify:CR=1 FL=1